MGVFPNMPWDKLTQMQRNKFSDKFTGFILSDKDLYSDYINSSGQTPQKYNLYSSDCGIKLNMLLLYLLLY